MGNLPARVAAVLTFAFAFILPAAPAAFGEVKVFPTEGFPLAITAGPDGNMWFSDPGNPPLFSSAQIGSVTPAGAVSKYTPGLSGYPWGIAKGPDGNLWFTEPGAQKVGSVKPSEPVASKTEFSVPGMPAEPTFRSLIAAGPDGNLWVTLGVNGIAKVTPFGSVTEYKTGLNAGADVCSVAAGPDGNVWFGDCGTTKAVGKITPAGAITEFGVVGSVGFNQPVSIVAGSDGRLWFPADNAADERLGAITTAGVVTYYKTPAPSAAFGLASFTAGPDGNVWAMEPLGENETQTITFKGEGPFKLGFEGQETGWQGKGTLTSGSTTVSGVTTTTGTIVKQELISGPGIPANTRVTNCSPSSGTACVNPTSLTLSAAATESGEKSLSADLAVMGTCGLNTTCQTATIKEALAQLSTILGSSNLIVSGSGGGPNLTRSVTFIGKFERTDVPLMTCTGNCTVETTTEARLAGLFHIKPATGAIKEFPLEPAIAPQPFVRANALASDGAGNLWFSVIGGIARFEVPIYHQLNLKVKGPGKILISPGGVFCPPSCEPELAQGSKITLTADPDKGAAFVSWTGCDVGGVNGRQCTVTMDNAKTITANFMATPPLTVSKAPGSGQGKVTSYPGGVLCLPNCSTTTASFKEGAKVKLTATPSKYSHFVEWLGDCTGSSACEVTMDKARGVEALFAEDPQYSLSLTKTGGGQGTVKSLPAGVNCGITCGTQAADFHESTVVVLTATVQAGKGSTFAGWSGAGCSGTGTCTVTIDEAKSVAAEFE